MPKQIARWNSARDVWEVQTTGLFCEHSDVFSETWPTSGTTRAGTAYALPTSVPLTDGSASSSLLPTPEAKLSDSGPDYARASRPGAGGDGLTTTLHRLLPTPISGDWRSGQVSTATQDKNARPLTEAVMLLPSPRATDGTKGGPNQRGSSGDLMLPSAVTHLLPTPACNDMGEGKTVDAWDAWTDAMQAKHGNGNGHGKSLAIEAQRLLPTPVVTDAKGTRNATLSRKEGSQHHSGETLTDALCPLLPTPSVADGMGGHMNRSGSRSNELLLPGVARLLAQKED